MQWLAPSHPQALALADRDVLNAVVLAHHRAIGKHDLTLTRRQVGIEKGLHRAVVVGQAEVLALGLLGRTQPMALRLQPRVCLGELAEGKHQPAQGLLG